MHVDASGWLYLGSHSGDSQLLAVPGALGNDCAADRPLSDAALRWRLADPQRTDSLACLAPVQDQLAYESPEGTLLGWKAGPSAAA